MIFVIVFERVRELDVSEAPNDLSSYALYEKLCSFLGQILFQSDPNESKIQTFSENRILLDILWFSFIRKMKTFNSKQTQIRVDF